MKARLAQWFDRVKRTRIVRKIVPWVKGAGEATAAYHDPFSGTPPMP